jgi:hypothetical protein
MSKAKKYPRPTREEVLEVIAAIPDENLRRRARDNFNERKGWNRTSASKNGSKKRWLTPNDRVLAHLLYAKGNVPDRIGECVLHCKWRNGMNFWNARNDGKRLLAAKRRSAAKVVIPKAEPVVQAEVQKAEPVEV